MHKYLFAATKSATSTSSRMARSHYSSATMSTAKALSQKSLIAARTGNITKQFPRHASAQVDTLASTSTSSPFKQWPTPMVESNGDYRAEAYLEKLIGGPLYSNQTALPRLPIPDVKDTITKLLPTALPLAESEEEKQSLLDACASFPSEAVELQRRLQARRDGEMKDSSWLQLWWNQLGYLQVRDPIVVNVSYFFHFSDDGTLPTSSLLGGNSDVKSLGVMRGAAMLVAAAEYRKKVCSGTLPCEAIGRKEPKTPLCSVAFKYMWNSTRVPKRVQDVYRMYDPSLHQHCIVARKGRFYSVDFVAENGDPLPLDAIEAKLLRIVELADEAESRDGPAPMLGLLSSSDRDSWADARDELLVSGGEKMEKALEKLESGALMLCLDDEHPTSKEQCAERFLTGGVSSGYNRWFDKSIQLICTNNGKSGLMGEHSMMDGMPIVGLADHITKTSYEDAKNKTYSDFPSDVYSEIEDVFEDVHVSTGAHECIGKAKSDFYKLIGDHELNVQSFQGYGSNYIKKAGFSPDAYVQMAIQLATARLWGKQGGTYEATQMRPFLHGRTETTRSVSPASAAFVKAMGPRPRQDAKNDETRTEKIALLHEAVASHVKYIGEAAKGNGIDRHLLGLSMEVADGEDAPALFAHPLYVRSKTWRVSTSHLTHPNFDNWGFGEVVPDGVGIGYAVKADSCVFNITARKEHDWTGRLSHLLEEALLEMQTMIDMDKPTASKL
mmetsp:Transcript_18668/g.40633  ORF Transcript_18668/g.40633 Transcript_18668/m.40633 type:complete len:725 (-) Transcript_18668:206-2380(-)